MSNRNPLSSNAKQLVYRTIFTFGAPTHLRRVITLTGLLPRSVQLAVRDLHRQKLIVMDRVANKKLYSVSRTHPEFSLLAALCNVRSEHQLRQRAEKYPSLDSSVQFMAEASAIMAQVNEQH